MNYSLCFEIHSINYCSHSKCFWLHGTTFLWKKGTTFHVPNYMALPLRDSWSDSNRLGSEFISDADLQIQPSSLTDPDLQFIWQQAEASFTMCLSRVVMLGNFKQTKKKRPTRITKKKVNKSRTLAYFDGASQNDPQVSDAGSIIHLRESL